MIRTFTLTLALMIVATAPAFAQFETGSLLGTITDDSGAVVDGATVTLSNVDTGVTQTRTTDGSGTFEFVTL
jgi:hypothetical protein